MDNTSIVTAIIPAYNARMWICCAIRSVLRQSIDDWQLIVVDDGSTDGTYEEVGHFLDNRIQLIRQTNQGPNAARNAGICQSRGKYIAFLDADDEYASQFLQRTTAFLEVHAECGVLATNTYYVDSQGKRKQAFPYGTILQNEMEGIVGDYCLVKMQERSFPLPTGLVLRRELVKTLGAFDPHVLLGEELEFLLRWLKKTKLGYIHEPLTYYRAYINPNSLIKNFRYVTKNRIGLWKRIMEHDNAHLKYFPNYRRLRDYFLFRGALISVAAGFFEEANQIRELWPFSPKSIFFWLGAILLRMPTPLLRIIHLIIGRTTAVKYRYKSM